MRLACLFIPATEFSCATYHLGKPPQDASGRPESMVSPMIECKENEQQTPICPHCNAPVTEVWYQSLRGFLGRRYIYFCSHCRKVLGVSHRKGFWMG